MKVDLREYLKDGPSTLDTWLVKGVNQAICNYRPTPALRGLTNWVFPKIVVPQNGWFIMENPIKCMILWYPYFWTHPTMGQWTTETLHGIYLPSKTHLLQTLNPVNCLLRSWKEHVSSVRKPLADIPLYWLVYRDSWYWLIIIPIQSGSKSPIS